MAVAITSLSPTGNTLLDSSSDLTVTIDAAAAGSLIVVVTAHGSASTPAAPVVTGGDVTTWSTVHSNAFDTASGWRHGIFFSAGYENGAGSPTTITVNPSNAVAAVVCDVIQVTGMPLGVDLAVSPETIFLQWVNGSGSSSTESTTTMVTLTDTTNNAWLWSDTWNDANGGRTNTIHSGFTEMLDLSTGPEPIAAYHMGLYTQFNVGDATVNPVITCTRSTSFEFSGASCCEIAAAAASVFSGPLVNGGLVNNSLANGHSLVNA